MKNVLLCLLMKHAQEFLYLPWNDMPVIYFCTLFYELKPTEEAA